MLALAAAVDDRDALYLLPDAGEKNPGKHSRQVIAPLVGAILPGLQGVHSVIPSSSEKVPSSHGGQIVSKPSLSEALPIALRVRTKKFIVSHDCESNVEASAIQ